jgi:hypothetical protein
MNWAPLTEDIMVVLEMVWYLGTGVLAVMIPLLLLSILLEYLKIKNSATTKKK